MKSLSIIVIVAFIIFGIETFAQTIDPNNARIGDSGSYNFTKSEEAKKYFYIALDYFKAKKYKDAIINNKEAIKYDTNFVEAYDNLGLSYRQIGELDSAEILYKKSIELYYNGLVAHQNLAAVYEKKEMIDEALNEYEVMKTINPDNPEGYYGSARMNFVKQNYDVALENAFKSEDIYKKENNPWISDSHYYIGLIYYNKGDQDNAKKYLQLAKDLGVKISKNLEEKLNLN